MADRDDAVLAIKSYGKQYAPAFRHWLAYMGDGNGAVHTSQANFDLVRYPLSSSPAVEVYNTKAPGIDGLRVIVGYTAQQPNLLQVIDVADQRVDSTSGDETIIVSPPYAYLPNHAQNHMYLNVDPVFVNWRQITPLGVFPTNPASLSVQIWAGYIPRPGADIFVNDQTVDLTSHVPGSGARYVLISYDSTGAPVVTDGTINSGGFSALTAADIPDTPAGNWRTCAVVLYPGQTAIVETGAERDFYDLRFPEESAAGTISIAPSQISGATAQYQYIVSGPNPYTPVWSAGFLHILSGKTLIIDESTEIDPTGATSGKSLVYNGSKWVVGNAGHVIQDEGITLTNRPTLNFVGTGVVVTDDSVNSATVVTIEIAQVGAYNETQTANGTNTIYYLANYALAGTITVYINGILQPLTNDTINTDTITFALAPAAGALLTFSYQLEVV